MDQCRWYLIRNDDRSFTITPSCLKIQNRLFIWRSLRWWMCRSHESMWPQWSSYDVCK